MAISEGFVSAGDLSLEALKASCAPRPPQAPSAESVAAMAEHFRSIGYRADVPQLYRALVDYGAAELDDLNTRGLCVKGDCGVGKTLGVQILAERFRWVFTSAAEYPRAYLENSRAAFDDIADGRDFFGRPARVVVIDDLGSEPRTTRRFGDELNVLEYVLERRYLMFRRCGARTIVTSNLSDGELARRYGARIDDRFNEMMDFVCANGESLRRRPVDRGPGGASARRGAAAI